MAADVATIHIGNTVRCLNTPDDEVIGPILDSSEAWRVMALIVADADLVATYPGVYTLGVTYWVLQRPDTLTAYWDDVEVSASGGTTDELTVTLTGLFGAPLQFVVDALRASATFDAFWTGGLYLFDRRNDPTAGDVWAELGYPAENGSTSSRRDSGPGLAAFEHSRTVELVICQATAEDPTEDDIAGLINTIGAIVHDIAEQDDAVIISRYSLGAVGIDDKSSPVVIGATVNLHFGES